MVVEVVQIQTLNICDCNLNDNLYYENKIDTAIATQPQ
jgi:hypothetical protein